MAEIYFNDVESCCRTCLNDDSSEMYDIFAKTQDSVSVADVLTMYAALKVDKVDSLPKIVCHSCHNHLISFYNFRQNAEKAETTLKNRIESNKEILIDPCSLQNELIHIKSENLDITQDYNILNTGLDAVKNEKDCKTECNEFGLETQDDAFDINDIDTDPQEISFKCMVCHKKFKTATRFALHVKKCSKPEYACKICPKKFQKHLKFMKHLLSHGKTEPEISEINQNEPSEKFECGVCSVNFKSFNSLAAHMRKHTKKSRVLACSICGKVFKKVSHVKRHELCHEENRPFKCSVCPKRFNTESLLNEHLNKHNIKSENQDITQDFNILNNGLDAVKDGIDCKTEGNEFGLETQDDVFDVNDLDTDPQENSLKCMVCHKKFKIATRFAQHVKKCSKPEYACTICPKKFQKHLKFMKHLLSHGKTEPEISEINQNEPSEKFECGVCSVNFKAFNSLAAHMRKHTKKGRVLACSICGKVFKKVSHVKRHELCHEENRPFKCSVCPKRFNTESLLNEHSNKHNKIKPHCCPICNKSFAHLSTLSTHIKIHTREKRFLCPTCGKNFDCSTNLNQHMRRHMGLKTFACSMCPKKFVSKGELKSHTVTHTGERKWPCSQCNSAFTTKGSLKYHLMRHAGVRRHQCDVCPMKFVTRDHLKRHYRIHTGEKPYKCDMCERAFTQSNDLIKHKRAHLGENVYKCTECSQGFRLRSELRHHMNDHYMDIQQETQTVDITTVKGESAESSINDIQAAESVQ